MRTTIVTQMENCTIAMIMLLCDCHTSTELLDVSNNTLLLQLCSNDKRVHTRRSNL